MVALAEVGYLAASEFPRADASNGPYKYSLGWLLGTTAYRKVEFCNEILCEMYHKATLHNSRLTA